MSETALEMTKSFIQYRWGLGIKGVKDKCPWAFNKMESQCLGIEFRVPGSSNIPTFPLQTEDTVSTEFFLTKS